MYRRVYFPTYSNGLKEIAIGLERLFDVHTLRLMSKADEVIEIPIGHTLDVHKNGRALNGEQRGANDMDPGILDGESFELVVVLDRLTSLKGGRLNTPSSPGTVPVRELCYCRNAFLLAFHPLFRSHCRK